MFMLSLMCAVEENQFYDGYHWVNWFYSITECVKVIKRLITGKSHLPKKRKLESAKKSDIGAPNIYAWLWAHWKMTNESKLKVSAGIYVKTRLLALQA